MPNSETLILGIESSCDETAAAVVRDGRAVLSNVIASQHDLHAKFGGVVPEIASRAHIENILPVIDEALKTAGIRTDEIDALAVGHRPGLIGSLLVGVSAAKAMAWALGKPLIGVDHVQAHLIAGSLDAEPITYPALGLVVSGGHTSLYAMDGSLSVERLGATIDDAVGEAYDKAASILEIGYPGGPLLDQLAQQGDSKNESFPRTLLDKNSLDFSFSGLKTAVLYRVRGTPQGRRGETAFTRAASDLSDQEKADIAAAFQEAASDVLITKLQRALDRMIDQHRTPKTLVIGGGVSANSLLRQRVVSFGQQTQLAVRLPKMDYCIDNAAMIAALGHERFMAGESDGFDLEAASTTR